MPREESLHIVSPDDDRQVVPSYIAEEREELQQMVARWRIVSVLMHEADGGEPSASAWAFPGSVVASRASLDLAHNMLLLMLERGRRGEVTDAVEIGLPVGVRSPDFLAENAAVVDGNVLVNLPDAQLPVLQRTAEILETGRVHPDGFRLSSIPDIFVNPPDAPVGSPRLSLGESGVSSAAVDDFFVRASGTYPQGPLHTLIEQVRVQTVARIPRRERIPASGKVLQFGDFRRGPR